MNFSATDHLLMARALELAERGAFTTKPNPMVGCVLAQGDVVVGEGWHVRAGTAHAEAIALATAGARAKGATAYVTLEPCAHTGRTPPCADALVNAGVARVVAAIGDPFPEVAGRGLEALRTADIVVETGLMATAAREQNRGFLSRVERGRPWVRVKLAMSLDGRTALADGSSRWISSEASRADAHRWRARCGALLTASGTVLADNPHLTVRLGDATEFVPPLRVVLDPGLAIPERSHVFDAAAPTLLLHDDDARVAAYQRGPDRAVVASAGGRLDLAEVLKLLAKRGVNEVQTEAGATLAGALLAQDLVDELLLYVAPSVLGDKGLPLFAGFGLAAMSDRYGFSWFDQRRVGDDLRLLLRPMR
ncbi:MAG: bifunctional diaminohydroxyphosphoribosylaminopyrimidine deaminase/5-amino-6-(5-phosphoribosylamino)uracil reductase RibD [Lysobacterales bacterium]